MATLLLLIGVFVASNVVAARTFVIVGTNDKDDSNTTGDGPISLSLDDAGAGWTGAATAVSDYGISRARVDTVATSANEKTFAQATAGWEDVFTVSGGVPGTVDTISFGVHVTGFLETGFGATSSGAPYASMRFILDRGTTGTTFGSTSSGSSGDNAIVFDDMALGTLDFIYGSPFRVRGFLELDTEVRYFSIPADGSAKSDFLSTAVLSQVILPDGAVLTAESGTSYPVVVPVPGAIWFFGSGLLGLVGIARRKKAA